MNRRKLLAEAAFEEFEFLLPMFKPHVQTRLSTLKNQLKELEQPIETTFSKTKKELQEYERTKEIEK